MANFALKWGFTYERNIPINQKKTVACACARSYAMQRETTRMRQRVASYTHLHTRYDDSSTECLHDFAVSIFKIHRAPPHACWTPRHVNSLDDTLDDVDFILSRLPHAWTCVPSCFLARRVGRNSRSIPVLWNNVTLRLLCYHQRGHDICAAALSAELSCYRHISNSAIVSSN